MRGGGGVELKLLSFGKMWDFEEEIQNFRVKLWVFIEKMHDFWVKWGGF